jgi:hypothetical protein
VGGGEVVAWADGSGKEEEGRTDEDGAETAATLPTGRLPVFPPPRTALAIPVMIIAAAMPPPRTVGTLCRLVQDRAGPQDGGTPSGPGPSASRIPAECRPITGLPPRYGNALRPAHVPGRPFRLRPKHLAPPGRISPRLAWYRALHSCHAHAIMAPSASRMRSLCAGHQFAPV